MKKRIVALLLVSIIISIFAGCTVESDQKGTPVNEQNSTGDATSTDQNPEEASSEHDPSEDVSGADSSSKDDVTVEEQVIFEQNAIRITAKSLAYDSFWGPSLKLLIENDSDKNITVQIRDSVINGVMIDGSISCEVAAGKKANDEIVYMQGELDTAGIEIIKDIQFKFHIFETESWDTIIDSETLVLSTTANPAYVQTYDDSGFVALDKDGFKLVVKKLENEESFWGADIYVYIENNSEKNAVIQVRDVSVNGFMIDPIFSCEVLSKMKAYDTITFLESDLEDNNIDAIDELEMSFHIFSFEDMESILDSEIVKISFAE